MLGPFFYRSMISLRSKTYTLLSQKLKIIVSTSRARMLRLTIFFFAYPELYFSVCDINCIYEV